jgi:hypothetical protein
VSASTVVEMICASFGEVWKHPAFQAWHKEQQFSDNDMVAVNNSFVFRSGVDTQKSDRFLAAGVDKSGVLKIRPVVCEGMRFNVDLKLIPAKSKKQPFCQELEDAVKSEIRNLGKLIFLLVGTVEDTIVLEEPLDEGYALESVVLDPTLKSPAEIKKGKLMVREVSDQDRIWDTVKGAFGEKTSEEAARALKERIAQALAALGDRTYATLSLPAAGGVKKASVLEAIVKILKEEEKKYASAVKECDEGKAQEADSHNDVLRIAYNFASDAIGFLRLVTSLCDLKPLVSWCTIGEQYKLSEAFRELPWTRSAQKPSLANYERIIGDARNKAFHRLFPFSKPIDVLIPGASLADIKLRIFSEYSRRKENDLTYRDKEMIELLKEFTITREQSVPSGFWMRNITVMRSTIELFEALSDTLNLLLDASVS